MENLERFVVELADGFSGVELVITSTWRNVFFLDDIREHFPPSLRLKIVGVTPSLTAWGSRYKEILAYLKTNGLEGHNWLAIDDRAEEFRPDQAI